MLGVRHRVEGMPCPKTGATHYHAHCTVKTSQTKIMQSKSWLSEGRMTLTIKSCTALSKVCLIDAQK